MAKSYLFTEDPGHGWLRVPLKELRPIQDKITAYSYMNNKYAYLEEDCDMGTFLDYRFGKDTNWKELWNNGTLKTKVVENTFIRTLPPFRVWTDEEKKFRNEVVKQMKNLFKQKKHQRIINNASLDDLIFWKRKYGFDVKIPDIHRELNI